MTGGGGNPKGVPLLDYAGTRALSALEKRAQTPEAGFGRLCRVIGIEVPDDDVTALSSSQLPEDWHAQPAPDSTRPAGQAWAASLSSLCLMVPSVIIPSESHALINPLQPQLSRALPVRTYDFRCDSRRALYVVFSCWGTARDPALVGVVAMMVPHRP